MLNIIKPYVHEGDVEPSIEKKQLSKSAADAYRRLCKLKHRAKVDLEEYSKADIKELELKGLACLTMGLDTFNYVLLLGTTAMPVGMLKVRVIGGTGSIRKQAFNNKRKVR